MRRALVVEEDTPTRQSLIEILESDGCVVDAAGDGESAADLLARSEYEIVLLDLALPRTSGTDVMEHIACTRPQTLARTIVVSGSDMADVRLLFPEVCDAIEKPVAPTRLLSAVRRASESRMRV